MTALKTKPAAIKPADLIVRRDLALFYGTNQSRLEIPRPTRPEDGPFACFPLLPADRRLQDSGLHFPEYPFQLHNGQLYWLELEQARVLHLPAEPDPTGVAGPFVNPALGDYDWSRQLSPFALELLLRLLAGPEPPEVIAFLPPPGSGREVNRYLLTEAARYRVVRITEHEGDTGGMLDLPPPADPGCWSDPAFQPSAQYCQRRLLALQPELLSRQRYLTKTKARQAEFQQQNPIARQNRANSPNAQAYAEDTAKAQRGLAEIQREVAYWQARQALPDNPELWRQFLQETLLPRQRQILLRNAFPLPPLIEQAKAPFFTRWIQLVEKSGQPRLESQTVNLLRWQEELAALPTAPAAKIINTPAPTEPANPTPQPHRRPRRPYLSSASLARESADATRAFLQKMRQTAANPEALLQDLERNLLPAIVIREIQAARELTLGLDKTARGFLPDQDPRHWEKRYQEEKRLRQYWSHQREKLLEDARAARDQDNPDWPPPPALARFSPILAAVQARLEPLSPVQPAPADPQGYWLWSGLQLRPQAAELGKRQPKAYELIDRDSGQALAWLHYISRSKRGRPAHWTFSHAHQAEPATSREDLALLIQKALEEAVQTRQSLARITQRILLEREHGPDQLLSCLGLQLSRAPGGLAAAAVYFPEVPADQHREYRQLRRQTDGQVLWQLLLKLNSHSEFNLTRESLSWIARRPDQPGVLYQGVSDRDRFLKTLLDASLALGEIPGTGQAALCRQPQQ